MGNESSRTAWTDYATSLFRYAKKKLLASLLLMVALGLAEGVGLLLLIPLLALIGVGTGDARTGGLTDMVGRTLSAAGLPLNFYSILAVYVLLIALHAFAGRSEQVLNARIMFGYTRYLREEIYRNLSGMDWLSFTRMRTADITHVLTEDVQRVSITTHQALRFAAMSILTVIYGGVALVVSLPVSLLALGCGALLLFILRVYNSRAQKTGEQFLRDMNRMLGAITEHLEGMKLVKSYGVEDAHVAEFGKRVRGIERNAVDFSRSLAQTAFWHKVLGATALALCFVVASEAVHVPLNRLLVIAFLFARLLPRLQQLQQAYQYMINGLPSFESAMQLRRHCEAARESLPDRDSPPLLLERGVSLRGVSFCYDKDAGGRALNRVSLEIPVRQIVAVVGLSGGGKSTLADLLMGLLQPDEGTVLLDDQPLEGPLVHGWRKAVGYVPQETFLFHDTVRANLLWALPEATDQDLWHALKTADADTFVRDMPRGLDTVVGDRGVRLSGGQRQRIALARVLLRKPALLILDEATSALDIETERRIQHAILNLSREMAVLLIAHRFSTIRIAHNIFVIDRGEVVENGTWSELTGSDNSRFKAMVRAREDVPPLV